MKIMESLIEYTAVVVPLAIVVGKLLKSGHNDVKTWTMPDHAHWADEEHLHTGTWAPSPKAPSEFDTLIANILPVRRDDVGIVAREYLDPQHNQLSLEPEIAWHLLGGAEGLTAMRRNTDTLLALAALAQRWEPTEAIIVGERMRRDALRFRAALIGIQWGFWWARVAGSVPAVVAFRIEEAAAAYYLMRKRLILLYSTTHAGLTPKLLEAV